MNNKISTEKIKAVLSMVSMALLAIQHIVGIFAENVNISYIPLSVTYFTIFIGSYGDKDCKIIRRTSLAGVILIVLAGAIILTLSNYGISMSTQVNEIYTKIMFGIIGVISLILSILYIKRIISETEDSESFDGI